jgi:hypothetical protein
VDDQENYIRNIAEQAASKVAAPRWGLVTSYNSSDHTAKVLLQPEGTLSDELPISPMGGARYAPVAGQMAFLVPESQDSQALVISGFAFNDLNRPPATKTAIGSSASTLQPGEMEMLGPSGSSVRLNTDGSIYLTSSQGFNIEANITMKGNIVLDGSIQATQTIKTDADVIASAGSLDDTIGKFNSHQHIVETIGGPSDPPESQFKVNAAE